MKQDEAGYLWDDRRSGYDRRKFKKRRSRFEQRGKKDRRSPELPETIRYRIARTQLRTQLEAYQISHVKYRFIGVVVLVIAVFLGGIISLSPIRAEKGCDVLPRPGVNWSNCLLPGKDLVAANLSEANLHNSSFTGADLRRISLASATLTYANMASANLAYADLSNAVLRSANLQDANLGYAKLDYADLSYANLLGANLEGASLRGAKLDHAVWPDQRECTPGSVGFCR
ncbi:pentapeptide repeat-containing protein [Nitrosococcus watsonii]|uniref:pentapeptide repeat-containing protein n=1 Tax=Nitrosococcus watsonii TaxID=473531 RepID=UPI001E300621|nr:pentapeptide repeat-containing protein [Nitrosococcus watsonii]